MHEAAGFFVSVGLKFFFLLTPFFALSVFLTLTEGMSGAERRGVAVRSTVAVLIACFVVFFFGKWVFLLFGITLDSFRVGAGALLFVSALQLAQGRTAVPQARSGSDPAVVPLAIPVLVGPAVAGTILVMAAECHTLGQKGLALAALFAASAANGLILYLGADIEKRLGPAVLAVLSKLAGLILAAFASQIVFAGAKNLLGAGP